MNGAEQAAVLMLSIGEELAAEVMRHLEPEQVEQVGLAMSRLENVPPDRVVDVIGRFNQDYSASGMAVDAEHYVQGVLTQALGEQRARGLLGRIFGGRGDSGLDALRWMDGSAIAQAMADEHPQIIATVAAHLPTSQASTLLAELPRPLARDVIARLVDLEQVSPQALQALGGVVESAMAQQAPAGGESLGGVRRVAEVLNAIGGDASNELLELLREEDADLADRIEENLFVFENLLELDKRSMQALLREVQSETLLVALKGASNDLKDLVFSNMSKRAAELLREDLEARGPMRVADVEAAQKEILEVTRRLIDAGDISYGSGGADYV